jgi:hypothetical protein
METMRRSPVPEALAGLRRTLHLPHGPHSTEEPLEDLSRIRTLLDRKGAPLKELLEIATFPL